MTSVPVLALADFTKPFIIETYACAKGMGAILIQEGRPIGYFSKALALRHLGLSTCEKEFMVVLSVVDRWRHYLQGGHFIIRTDHHSLKYLLEQRVTTTLQQKGLTKLLGLDYEVEYKKGTENRVVDALSRRHGEESALNAITSVEPTWMEEVIQSYEHDPVALQLITTLISDPTGKPKYTLHQGVIRFEQRIYIGRGVGLRAKIFEALHHSPLGGHSGQQGIYRRVKMIFFWPNMQSDITKWVAECDVCQRVKTKNIHSPELLQPLPIPDTLWQDIAMEFVEGLPSSGHKNSIFVVADRLTKYEHFISLKHSYTAKEVAEVFLCEVYKLHGLPKAIVTDRDTIFTNQFWQHLFKSIGTKLNLTTSYHPQSDGQTERLNRCLEDT